MTHPIRKTIRRARSVVRNFLDQEAAGGLILMVSAAIALAIANSPASSAYFDGLHLKAAGMSISHWVNDGLMSLFFLLVGLEIKRELLDGELSTWSRRALPGIAAAGGMAIPALIYVGVNLDHGAALRGWAIPAATDIAFSLGVLSLLGARAPVSLKLFLMALAILDDLGAVLIIAVFYTEQISLVYLALSALTVVALIGLTLLRVKSLVPYLVLGAILWVLVVQSGIHATIAGVLLALTIPIKRSPGETEAADSPLHRLEHALSPWVAFLVVPIFGFANAGVSLKGFSLSDLTDSVPLGVALGLFIGKPLGVFGASLIAIKLGLAHRPAHTSRG